MKWKALFEKAKLKVNIFPLLVTKSFAKVQKIAYLLLKYDKDNQIVNLYYVADYFNNLTKNLIFTNSLNNVYVEDKSLIKFSCFNETELNNFIGVYNENNDYSVGKMFNTQDIHPIFKGKISNESLLRSSRYSFNLIKYILMIIIVLSVIGCFLQLSVVLNVIIRENIKYINIFKILGYSNLWVFNRLFLMYLPIVGTAYVLAISLGILICFFINIKWFIIPLFILRCI